MAVNSDTSLELVDLSTGRVTHRRDTSISTHWMPACQLCSDPIRSGETFVEVLLRDDVDSDTKMAVHFYHLMPGQ
jgi:hypothetical protein